MYGLKRNNILIMTFMFYGASLAAQNHQSVQDSVRIYFKQGKIDLVPTLRENQSALNRIADTMRITYADSAYQLRKILVVGGASPEGSVKFNQWLSEKRAKVLFDYLSRYGELPDSLRTTHYLGRDWNGLIRLVENDPQLPYRKETLSMLRQIASEQKSGAQAEVSHLQKIQKLRGGTPYLYMYREYFPLLRSSKLHLWYEKVHRSEIQKSDTTAAAFIPPADTIIVAPDTQSITSQRIRKPFYMDIRTNMLYDALLIPNIGVEMYLGKDGRWLPTGCTDGGRPTADTGTGEPTAVTSPSENGGERLPGRNRSPGITSASTVRSSHTTSKPEAAATWAESPEARSGTR